MKTIEAKTTIEGSQMPIGYEMIIDFKKIINNKIDELNDINKSKSPQLSKYKSARHISKS